MRKAFQVQVEIEIDAVTCPGVWLCPNGKVSLQVYMMGSCIQTSSLEPVFPLPYQEKFVFYKTFFSVRKLSGLQKLLGKEILYIELIQWQNCEVGNVIAIFHTSLADLLFPNNSRMNVSGADVDLLMEPMKNFPGILAPKIEVSTKIMIEDKVCSDGEKCHTYVVNPHALSSKKAQKVPGNVHQRKVCHSTNYHRQQKCSMPCQDTSRKPLFAYRKVDDDLITRKREDFISTEDKRELCKCRKLNKRVYNFGHQSDKNLGSSSLPCGEKFSGRSRSIGPSVVHNKPISCAVKDTKCDCSCSPSGKHDQDNCVICSKYNYYFESKTPHLKSKKIHQDRLPHRHYVPEVNCNCNCDNNNKLCNYPPIDGKLSLAEKIHNRLTETLNQCSSESPMQDACSLAPSCDCDCRSSEENCTVRSFGQFYKDFYRKSRAKCEQFISCN